MSKPRPSSSASEPTGQPVARLGANRGWVACAALLSTALATPAFADGLVDNVIGYTLDTSGRIDRFTGLLITPQGKVARLLRRDDKRPEKLDFRLDARGRTLFPGLIDAHGHVMQLGFAALRLDLAAATSLPDMRDRLARWGAAHPTPTWIQGGGWNQERWLLGRFPTADDIEPAVPGRPVWLMRIDGHAGLASKAAMAAAGVTKATQDPPGGRIERLPDGTPSGVFVDAAMALIERAVPAPLPRERDTALARAQDILLGYGITTTADMGSSAADWNAFRRAGDVNRLRVRIISYADGIDTMLSVAGAAPTPWLYGDRLRMVGVKLFADGALGSRGAWLKAPYADAPKQSGLSLLDDAKLRNLMSRAAMDGFQVAIHAIGDAANAQALDAIEELALTYKGDRRWRIEHAQIVDPADLPRFGRDKVIASMQPAHQPSDRMMAEARLGPDRLAGAYAWKSILDGGALLAFGSDFPVESPNPFAALAAATTRTDDSGQPAGGWRPEQRVTIEQALAAYTSGAAFAGFAEDRLGAIRVGGNADFLLLDRDPIADPAALRATRVEETWIGGVRAWVRK